MQHSAFSPASRPACATVGQERPRRCGSSRRATLRLQRGRSGAVRAAPRTPGPTGAFEEESKGEARQQLFNDIAPVYDQLNNALSLGQHHVWKRMAVKWSGAREGQTALDICCGSGDLAFLLAGAVGPAGKVVGLDFAQNMLDDAASREARKLAQWGKQKTPMSWIQGDAMALPFDDCSFDAATMGYGLRNVSDIPAALSELHRVLRPGCKAAILDFNNAEENPIADAAQGFVLENVVVPVASSYGLRDEYEYLRPSIKAFPPGKRQEQMAIAAGFASAKHYEISFGLMGVLVVQKEW